jgi:hypothetical protein
MLNRSIPTREALVHSISISEVKDMKSDVLRALKASRSENNFELCLWAQFKKNSRKKNSIDFECFFCNISTIGIDIF